MADIRQQWFADWANKVQDDYDRLHAKALQDIQQAGHGGESTWVELLSEWLPSEYEVATRKYIVPEEGDKTFETDIVVFRPGYPRQLRKREQVLAGGVAAAFSVKLTLDAAGIEDAADRAAALRRDLAPRTGSPQREMLGLFPVGLLSHSHDWKMPTSTPRENLERNLTERTNIHAKHPREILDIVCVSDLGTAIVGRAPYMMPEALSHLAGKGLVADGDGVATTIIAMTKPDFELAPVASLVTALYSRLALDDPGLRPLAESFRLTGMMGNPGGFGRAWKLGDVFTDGVVAQLRDRFLTGGEWGPYFI